ncbi:hypothetical protein V5799_034450 [Amblyomma americanum]|uniref:Uncharacterized protein n=1 Tax=Amblyomma americanum TaxID=6943 RepID=A0AAQ4DKE6_AMBAM
MSATSAGKEFSNTCGMADVSPSKNTRLSYLHTLILYPTALRLTFVPQAFLDNIKGVVDLFLLGDIQLQDVYVREALEVFGSVTVGAQTAGEDLEAIAGQSLGQPVTESRVASCVMQ